MRHHPLSRCLRLSVGCALALTAARRADAQNADSLYPLRALDRPTTLPRGASRLDIVMIATHQPPTSTGWTGIVGGGIGVWDRLEVGGQLVPGSLAPGDARFTNPSVYATYQFPAGKVSIAPTMEAVFPLASTDPFYVDVGMPVYYGVGTIGYVSIAPTLSIDTRANGAGTSLTLPVTFMRQIGAQFTWQVTSGVGMSRVDSRFGLSRRAESFSFDDTTIPLSAQAMYSLRRDGQRHPLADLTVQVAWPQLYTRTPASRGSHANDWTMQLQSSWYSIP